MYDIDNDEIIASVNLIGSNIKKLDKIDDEITKKSQEIYNLYINFEKKKYLNLGDSIDNLKFQLQIIMSEKQYLKQIKGIFLGKIHNDIYDIAENVIMVVSSLDDVKLEYQDENCKDNIMKKIIPIKKIEKNHFDIKHLIQLITSILHNLELIRNILELFDSFIRKTAQKIKDENFHCRNLENSLLNQKDHLIIEYNNQCQYLKKLLIYHLELSNCMLIQIQNHKLTEFCIHNQDTNGNTDMET